MREEQFQLDKADEFNRLYNPGTLVKYMDNGFSRQAKTSSLARYSREAYMAVVQIDGLKMVPVDAITPIESVKDGVREQAIKKLVQGYRAFDRQYMILAKDVLTAAEFADFEKIVRGEYHG